MKAVRSIEKKIYNVESLKRQVAQWRLLGKAVAFTNGCFDILHKGHIASLTQAAGQADYLIVAINADESVKKLKGSNRPLNDQSSRTLLIANLTIVDAVVLFEDDTPLQLIKEILPDVLVKGGDYKPEDIAGAKEVMANGGRVVITPIVPNFSTTALITKMQSSSKQA